MAKRYNQDSKRRKVNSKINSARNKQRKKDRSFDPEDFLDYEENFELKDKAMFIAVAVIMIAVAAWFITSYILKSYDSEKQVVESQVVEEEPVVEVVEEQPSYTLPDASDSYFNVVNDIPPIFETPKQLTFNYFRGIIPYSKRELCIYASLSFKSYEQANGEPRVYENFPEGFNVSDCASSSDNDYLYSLYTNLYLDFIETTTSDSDLEEKINNTKSHAFKSYVNLREDWPSFLLLDTQVSLSEFEEAMTVTQNINSYCNFYSNFVIINNMFATEKLTPVDETMCIANFNVDQAYLEYSEWFNYILYSLNDDVKSQMYEYNLSFKDNIVE